MTRKNSSAREPSRLIILHRLTGHHAHQLLALVPKIPSLSQWLYYYDRNHNCDSVVVKRFNYADESRKVLMEGTLLGWADSLLKFAYAFIHNFIADKKPAKSPFPIPLLRFVKAAIAYSEKLLVSAPGTSSGASHRAAYLLEELLPVDRPFIIMQRLCPSRILMNRVTTLESFFALSNTFNLSIPMVKPISLISKVCSRI